ncbi:MAG: phosphoribosylamine--glycine ligase, partial [Planctomycetes bacterium]|nr:phosphoribosylamine--glycine ligase [Planctomycetota bacterium]
VIGSGGREHALVRGLAGSTKVREVLTAGGNAGTAEFGENVRVDVSDLDALLALARERSVDLTVVGPEAPLCAGIVDKFEGAGLRVFGPTAAAARIEGDKAYAKRLMKTAKVPTAEGRSFTGFEEARHYVATRDFGVVIKAAGLAGGKGVVICPDPADGVVAVEQIMVDKVFGDAGNCVVVEELLKGPELSVLALVDGRTIYVLETAQDHKRVGENDTGLNTGGMGAYSPAPIATKDVNAVIDREILMPIVDALRNDGAPYRGVLYAGLMLTAAGPKVLEFNCRFGDPETQAILIRLESDLFDLLTAVVDGKLDAADVRWDPRPAVCVVMASAGYPGSYEKYKPIEGLARASAMRDVVVDHAGTRRQGNAVVTNGGRVLGVTALGDNIAEARARAYSAVDEIHFEGAFCRPDIAARAVET